MKKIMYLIAFLIAITFTQQTYASDNIAGRSATLSAQNVSEDSNIYANDARVAALEKVFAKYNSVLESEAEHYVRYADKYNIDWRLLPAIAGLESGFGRAYIHGSYNAYGWGGGRIYFNSWEEGIEVISRSLRTKYYDRGADTVPEIGRIYAESPTWSQRVSGYMALIDKEYNKMTLLSAASNI